MQPTHPRLYTEASAVSVFPRTPQRRGHDEINGIIKRLENDFRLGLSLRDETWSPSRSISSDAERCYAAIKFLYFQARPLLNERLTTFESSASNYHSHQERLRYLLKLLGEEVKPESGRKQLATKDGHVKTFSSSLRKRLQDVRRLELDAGRGLPQAIPRLHDDSSAQLLREAGLEHVQDSIAYESANASRPGTPTEDDDDDGFATPPQSPSLMVTAHNRVLDSSPQLSKNDESFGQQTSPRPKRPSDGIERDVHSPKYTRTSDGKQPSSIFSVPEPGVQRRSVIDSATIAPLLTTSFDPTNPSMSMSFSTNGYRDNTTTANTSFTTDASNIRYPQLPPSSCAAIGSLDDDTLIDVMKRHDLDNPVSTVTNNVSTQTFPATNLSHALWAQACSSRSEASKVNGMTFKYGSPSETPVEHFQVRQLPTDSLFVPDSPESLEGAPFIVRLECCRIAIANSVTQNDVMTIYDPRFSDYNEFWEYVTRNPKCPIIPKQNPQEIWDAAPDYFRKFSLKGSLIVNDRNQGKIFSLELDTFQKEDSCRFQRAYGSDRFLYLTVPSLKKLPRHLNDQKDHLQRRYQQWLKAEHSFLGRKWRVFHVETQTGKKSRNGRKESNTQRLVLFATTGCDLQARVLTETMERSRIQPNRHESSIRQLLDWFMSFEQNSEQPFCKAYARLDLGLSKTVPTMGFWPSQIYYIRDTLPDGTPEDTQFNDPCLKWKDLVWTGSMNDGCSRISVGAAKVVWSVLRTSGPIPSIFQARIGGAKGVWILSAPTSTQDAFHQSIWIEISESQLKFKPHEADIDKSDAIFDPNRLTFEVLKYARRPVPATLHAAFLPILLDRGVPKMRLAKTMQDFLNYERKQLIDIIADPVRLRIWLNEQHSLSEENKRNFDIAWQAGLPLALTEKVILFLESGFSPKESRFVANLVDRMISRHLMWMRQNLTLRIGRSTNVMGIADPLGVLQPGEIHLYFSSSFIDDISGEMYPWLDGQPVLVGRHPALRRSDIQKVRAVYKHELSHLVDVVVFPSKGSCPLAHKLQGGDYDGDTFWVCWDPTLTTGFRNAPAPMQSPIPEAYGIEVDRRTLHQVVPDAGSVNLYLQECFLFRCYPSLLGMSTVFHESLCYWENNIDSPGINALSDIHDLLVDSAKNGFKYDNAAYQAYVQGNPNIRNKTPAKPAYKTEMEKKRGDKHLSHGRTCPKPRYKSANIIDHLFFEIVMPHNEETLEQLQRVLSTAVEYDHALCIPYLKECRDRDEAIEEEFLRLKSEFKRLQKLWGNHLYGKGDFNDADIYNQCLDLCFTAFKKLQPTNTEHRIIRRWTRENVPGRPTDWELIKASLLFTKHHMVSKQAFVFHIAGRELAHIKAYSTGSWRLLAQPIWANMKPRKTKKPLIEEVMDVVEISEDSDDHSVFQIAATEILEITRGATD